MTDTESRKQLAQRLREHLNEMMAAAQLLEPLLSGSEKGRGYLAVMERGMHRQLLTIRRLELELNLSDRDEVRLAARPTELVELCRTLTEQLAALAGQLGVAAAFTTAQTALTTVTDPRAVEDLLLLLVAERVKAMPEGGALDLRLERQDNRAVLTLRDSGAGMGPADMTVLTAPDSDALAGDLSGLALAGRTAALLGGKVLVESREHGVSIAISLPLLEQARGVLLNSPWPDDGSGRDRMLAALSESLPAGAFLPGDREQ